MDSPLSALDRDRLNFPELIQTLADQICQILADMDQRPVAHKVPEIDDTALGEAGIGAEAALTRFLSIYAPWMSASAGPRYFGFVTGGTTPAALLGDWLTSTFDQNASDAGESSSRALTLDTLAKMKDLLGLPEFFNGTFVTGATASSTVGLALAREYCGDKLGVSVSEQGLSALGNLQVLSGCAHGSIGKAMSILGFGRAQLKTLPTLSDREALDVSALEAYLNALPAQDQARCIVVANAGTVNTCDFDDIAAIAALKKRFGFWLHVDAAFGGIAGVSAHYRDLLVGWEQADSITVDAHKWLNVPYDCGVLFTPHLALQGRVYSSAGAYLPQAVRPDTFIHLSPENSQRLRALPLWMTLTAYGREGYAEIVERCCTLAASLGDWFDTHPAFELLAPVRLNGICFALAENSGTAASEEEHTRLLNALAEGGVMFTTPTQYCGRSAIRLSISNWRTRQHDIERTQNAFESALKIMQ